jgi:hypothetical protein
MVTAVESQRKGMHDAIGDTGIGIDALVGVAMVGVLDTAVAEHLAGVLVAIDHEQIARRTEDQITQFTQYRRAWRGLQGGSGDAHRLTVDQIINMHVVDRRTDTTAVKCDVEHQAPTFLSQAQAMNGGENDVCR